MMEFGPLRVGEQDIFTFNFNRDIAQSISITGSPTVSVVLLKGNDGSPQDMIVGSPSIAGAKVSALINGTVENNIYIFTCTVKTTANQILKKVGRLLILPANTPENLLLDSVCDE